MSIDLQFIYWGLTIIAERITALLERQVAVYSKGQFLSRYSSDWSYVI
ncbi:hypothetical protein J7E78_08175 [Paenibacillus polymyxa]|nr:hypothetical protein [Paenibacillus polymyxa]MBT2283511.1 hypothetical protein [Paenibacillus polymyxa]